MPDTVLGGYSCPCGWVGNSRQALHWHKTNSCRLRELPQAPQAAATAAPVAKVEPPEPAAVQQEKPEKVALVGSRKAKPEPEPEEPEDAEQDDEKEKDDDDKFDVLLLPLIIVVLIVAGLFIFREKILEVIERMKGGQPPAYGVPSYG